MNEIDALLTEERKFPPPPEFAAHAVIKDPAIYQEAASDPEAYWAREAARLDWIQPWTQVFDWKPPHYQWFVGGKLNAAANCVDRHAFGARRNKPALIWRENQAISARSPTPNCTTR